MIHAPRVFFNFNFETDGNTVMVYDTMAILGAIGDWLLKWLGSFGACCCGSVILMIGHLGLMGWKVTVISSNFIALMLILNMAMNIHVTVRLLQLKKELNTMQTDR